MEYIFYAHEDLEKPQNNEMEDSSTSATRPVLNSHQMNT